ncbi:MAG: type II toxin-antitoxin system RelE/ParE family toxin, partial [Flavobacteriaceae bacterium]
EYVLEMIIEQGEAYFDAFFACFNTIAERPFSFESVDYIKTGYRRCVCGVDSIYFKVSLNVVEIIAILGRQDITSIV